MLQMCFRHILFPIDYSPLCTGTIPYVKEMARGNRAQVTVINVNEMVAQLRGIPDMLYFLTAGTPAEQFQDGQRRLANFVRQQFADVSKRVQDPYDLPAK